MREDMQYISGVMDELEAIVQDASGVPMRKGRAVEEEAERIIEDAGHRADAMVPDTELYRRAQRGADEIIDRAERYAEEVANGSEVYRDRVMGQLENWFQDSIVSVGESRQELSG